MNTVHLNGRPFVYVGASTLEHDVYTMGALARAGLLPVPARADGETEGQYGHRLLVQLAVSGEFFSVLGCLLVPQEAGAWSPDAARETEGWAKSLSAPTDRDEIEKALASALLPFFLDESSSSPSSSASTPILMRRKPASDRPTTDAMETGAHSSAS